jgi:hypothetical protein
MTKPFTTASFSNYSLYVCVIILLMISIAFFNENTANSSSDRRSIRKSKENPPAKLGTKEKEKSNLKSELSNCKSLYIDVGTNIGVQIRKLFEPNRYPHAAVLPIFDEYFGDQIRNKSPYLCAIGFELNPSHTKRLIALENHYKKNCGYKVQIFTGVAASVTDGEIDFWTNGDKEHLEWGATTNSKNIDTSQGNMRKNTVSSIDISEFLLQNLLPQAERVVMKLDIEGAEHNVLPRLMLSGALCKIDMLFLETHDSFYTDKQRSIVKKAMNLYPEFMSTAGCHTRVEYLDDESYLHDADNTLNTC